MSGAITFVSGKENPSRKKVHTKSPIWGPDVETVTWGARTAVAIRQLLQKWRMIKSNVGLSALTVHGMKRREVLINQALQEPNC
eukprot:6463649-Amphidinium_carterae.1